MCAGFCDVLASIHLLELVNAYARRNFRASACFLPSFSSPVQAAPLRPVHAQELSIKLLEEDPEKNADYLQVGLGALQLDTCTQRWVCSFGRETKQA